MSLKIFEAAQLEFNQLMESKLTIFLFFLVPAFIVYVLYFIGAGKCNIQPGCDQWFPKNFDLLAPSLLPVIVLFISSQLTILRIVAERAPYGTLDRDLIAIPHLGMFLGKLLVNILISVLQATVVLLTAVFLGVSIIGNIISAWIILTATGLVGVSMGLMFSIFSSSKEQAVQFVPYALLIMLIFSGIFIQPSQMPAPLNQYITLTPLASSYNALSIVFTSYDIFQGKVVSNRLFDVSDRYLILWSWFLLFTFAGLIKFISER